MTEAEWYACTDPSPMLEFLRGKAGDRKLRLFGVACCRRHWHLLTDRRWRAVVEVGEDYADGLRPGSELWRTLQESNKTVRRSKSVEEMVNYSLHLCVPDEAEELRWGFICSEPLGGHWMRFVRYSERRRDNRGKGDIDCEQVTAVERAAQATCLRDIFGNPFGHISASPNWLFWNDGAVRKLAQSIYDDRAFNRLPLLADALEDAGCTDAAILSHCREPGEHVRGCWVVDQLLGKC